MQRKPTRAVVPVSAAVELDDFLRENEIGVTRAAEAIGVSHPALINWLKGVNRPGDHHRKAIDVWTNGRVKEDMWLTDEERAALAGVEPYRRTESSPELNAVDAPTGTEQ